ncbi:baseplate protein [Pantoea phage Phynn]|nr:baseplate protein [Pantoea phage Phynn]
MKQIIGIGNVVDDGTGDYLRRGGQKTNENFKELYDKLGDGETPHPAGAWKVFSGVSLSPAFGESWALNTTNNRITVNLPKGNVSDYGKVIRLRDVWAKWSTNNVKLVAATGDTIKGSPVARELYRDLMDVEIVYCSPGKWEYVENKQVDKITTSDLATVAKVSFIATQGQTDFPNIFGVNSYNIRALDVFWRGNMLYIDDDSTDGFKSENSDYGSIGASEGELIDLDGHSIRLKNPCNEGDTVQFVTYMDGIASWRSTYESHTVRFYNEGRVETPNTPGEIFVGDLKNTKEFPLSVFGIASRTLVNPNSFELLLNGRQLVKSGDADYPSFVCEGANGYDEDTCLANGGAWIASGKDYSLLFVESIVNGIKIHQELEDGDVVTVRWFNNDIGTTMEWEGTGGIKEHTDQIYLNNEEEYTRMSRIEYTDYNNPSQKTARKIEEPLTGRITDIQSFFDVIYPPGTLYENAHNPANPGEYMGMGIWARYAEGMFVAGWSSNVADPDFALNNNDLDGSDQPTHTSGGTGGERGVEIKPINIPQIHSTDKVLIADNNGIIIVGGCQLDPDAEGPGYTKYREDVLQINKGNTVPDKVKTLPPYITAHRWIRVA